MYKLPIAKKLFKESFKSGLLRIQQDDNREIYVCGKDWIMWFDDGAMPKEIKGELISLCGNLPDPGSAYTAYPDGNQLELLTDDMLPDLSPETSKQYNTTRFYYSKGGTVGAVLWSRETKKLMLIDTRAMPMIVEGDNEVINGPYGAGDHIYWQGNGSVFCIASWHRGQEDDEVERFLKALEEGWL